MLHMLVNVLVMAGSVYLIARLVPGVRVEGFKNAVAVAVVYGLINFLLFRVLILITFPLVVLKYLTLGVFGVIINAVMLMITDKLLDGFELSGFGAAVLAALGISLVNVLVSWVLPILF